MNLEVQINPEQINQAVADAIIKSAIGEQLTRIIDEEVKKLSNSYNSPIKPLVQHEIETAVRTIIHEQYAEMIRERVRVHVTEAFTDDLLDKLWKTFTDRY